MLSTLELAVELISRPSITPHDAGCQSLIANHLQSIGFVVETLRFDEVDNLWARHGQTEPLLVFAGHTDVVPPGLLKQWQFPPFTPTVHEGLLYGRGAADMKGSLAAMVVACERFVQTYPDHPGSIGLLLTSDEEGVATNGTVKVIDYLQAKGDKISWCLVGEPSSVNQLGDTIKNGRRGSLNGHLIIQGVQGHVAYPHQADNPIHRFAPLLKTLCETQWDQGNEFFPPTGLQITHLNAGEKVDNVIPGELEVLFNFRYSTEVTHTQLQAVVTRLLEQYQLNSKLTWRHSGLPFLTPVGTLVDVTQQAILEVCGYQATLSTAGGTSDGRFIAPTGAQVIELGPLNATIHKVNECVRLEDLETLATIYQRIIEKLLR
jgi:succinyl-diaminopimelate desuccinylase